MYKYSHHVQLFFVTATSPDVVPSLSTVQLCISDWDGAAAGAVRQTTQQPGRVITGNIQTFLTVVCKTLSDMHYSSLPSALLWCRAHRATPGARAGRGAQHCIIAIVPFVGGLSQPTICRQFQAEPCVGKLAVSHNYSPL